MTKERYKEKYGQDIGKQINEFYWEKKLNLEKTAIALEITRRILSSIMESFEIETRTNSEPHVGIQKGSAHPKWKEKIVKVCLICGKSYEVIPSHARSKFCSYDCVYIWKADQVKGKNNPAWEGGPVEKICLICNKLFNVKKAVADITKLCSKKCANKYLSQNYSGSNSWNWKGGHIQKICLECGTIYSIKKSHVNKSKFCSRECLAEWKSKNMSGEKSPRWKKRIIRNCPTCNKEFYVVPSKYENKYCSRSCFDKIHSINMTGQNNYNWQDGISFEPYPSEFNRQLKELIHLRDNYFCQKCGRTEIEEGQKLAVHHVNYNKNNCLPDNLITLCRSCNGKVNKDKDEWTKYFENKIKEKQCQLI